MFRVLFYRRRYFKYFILWVRFSKAYQIGNAKFTFGQRSGFVKNEGINISSLHEGETVTNEEACAASLGSRYCKHLWHLQPQCIGTGNFHDRNCALQGKDKTLSRPEGPAPKGEGPGPEGDKGYPKGGPVSQ